GEAVLAERFGLLEDADLDVGEARVLRLLLLHETLQLDRAGEAGRSGAHEDDVERNAVLARRPLHQQRCERERGLGGARPDRRHEAWALAAAGAEAAAGGSIRTWRSAPSSVGNANAKPDASSRFGATRWLASSSSSPISPKSARTAKPGIGSTAGRASTWPSV